MYGVSWRDDRGVWGLAVKSEDGALRGASAALREVLVGGGVVAPEVWVHPPILGGGTAQGVVRPAPEVTAAAARLA